jgi:hypothetical protein
LIGRPEAPLKYGDLSTIIPIALDGCSRFDEAKEREGGQKAHPNDQVAVDKCLKNATHEWEKVYAWLPRLTHRRDPTP